MREKFFDFYPIIGFGCNRTHRKDESPISLFFIEITNSIFHQHKAPKFISVLAHASNKNMKLQIQNTIVFVVFIKIIAVREWLSRFWPGFLRGS